MIIENKPIKNVGNLGHITLDKLALPYSVKVSFQGEQIIPLSFDIFGHPNFTKEQTRIFRLKQAEISRESKDNSLPVVEISYEERVFDKPKNYFDSIMAVQDKIVTLSFFYELLNDRALFIKSHPNQTLNEFVVFGWLLLDKLGSIRLIKATKEERDKLIRHGIVESYENFKNNNSSISFYSTRYHIPKDGTICQCCCNKFMMKDFKDSPCIYIESIYAWYEMQYLSNTNKSNWLNSMIPLKKFIFLKGILFLYKSFFNYMMCIYMYYIYLLIFHMHFLLFAYL